MPPCPFLNSSAPVSQPPPLPGRILVVDDNESIRVFLGHFFRLEGIPVEILDSPVRALELFRAQPKLFSMLLTDCEMPGMSGLELAYEVRRVRADLPMVIFSTSVTVLGPNRFLSRASWRHCPSRWRWINCARPCAESWTPTTPPGSQPARCPPPRRPIKSGAGWMTKAVFRFRHLQPSAARLQSARYESGV